MMFRQLRILLPMLFLLPNLSAHAQWQSDPALNNIVCQEGSNQTAPRIISDMRGGAIICWHDQRAPQAAFDVYAQRIDKDGFVRWTVNGNIVTSAWNSQSKPEMVSDGAGGAIIAWTDTRNDNNDVYAQRIDGSGNVMWTADGVPIANDPDNEADPRLISDGNNGAIITWNAGTGGFPPTSRIYAQRVDGDGNPLWGTPVRISGNLRFSNAPSICSDGAGGAYIAYAYYPRPEYDVYAQRVDANGAIQWAANGVPIANNAGTQDSPLIVPDGTGKAFLTYLDWGSGSEPKLHIVVLKPDGTQANSMRAASTSGEQNNAQLAQIGTGLCGVAWEDARGGKKAVYAHIVDNTGAKSWTADGLRISNRGGPQEFPYVIPDENGGMIVAWEDKTRGTLNSDIYAQRISDAGALQWSDAGAPVSIAQNGKQFPRMIPDGFNGALVTWEDYRPSFSNGEIYASRILADGSFPDIPPALTYSSMSVDFGAVSIGKTSTENLTLTNVGDEAVTISAVTSSDPHFAMTPTSNTIDANGSITAAVEFSPDSKATLSAVIVVQSNSILGPDTIAVTGFGTASAVLETDVSSLDFGSVPIGTTKALPIRITNAGNETLSISGITSSSPRFTVDIGAKDLAPGISFDDTVRFMPTASGPISAELTLTSNAPDSPKTIPLTGSGLSVVTLSIDPAEIDFGNVLVGTTKDTVVKIMNTGNDTLRITSFVADDARFTNATSIKTILPAGAVNFTLRFSPDAAGTFSSEFTVESNATTSPDAFTVSGTGMHDPAVSFAPGQLSFGAVDIGSEGTLVLTVSSTGSRNLSVTGIISSNPDFSADERQFDVAGGSSFEDTIRFAPSVAGSRTGFLVITSNAATSPDTVLVEGTGTDVSAVRPLHGAAGTFTLYQNYPNPFHPSTTIRYDLKSAAAVRVTVRNTLGQVVATLTDELQSPGTHSVRWDAGGMPPGLYFYVVRVAAHEAIGTMLLMK